MDPYSDPEATMLVRDELVFDDVRSLVNESFVTLLGSVEPSDGSGTIVSVRVAEVLSDLTPYVDTMSVTAPLVGDVVDIDFSDRHNVPPAAADQVVVFAAFGRGQWYLVGGRDGAYSVGTTLEGAAGSLLDGRDATSALQEIRTEGDEQEQVMAAARADESAADSSTSSAEQTAFIETSVVADSSTGKVQILITNPSRTAVETPLYVELQVQRAENWETVGFVPVVGANGVATMCPTLDGCEAAALSSPLEPGDTEERSIEVAALPAGSYRAVAWGIAPEQQQLSVTEVP